MAEILIPYRGNRNPDTIELHDFTSHPERGANCQTTALGILDRLGFDVLHLRSLEMVQNNTHFADVQTFGDLKAHDIIIFQAIDGRTDRRSAHPTVAHIIKGGTLFLAHNSIANGRAVIEPARTEDQGRIIAIKRPIARPNLPDVQFLTRVGFQPLVISQ